METAIPIVSTKLQPPLVRDDILPRPRLLNALALTKMRRATLLCAGPGYGKTTLVSVIAASHAPVVWYSLSRRDSDVAVFISYLVHGVRVHEPEFGEGVLQMLSRKGDEIADPEIIAGELVNALDKLRGSELLIILDDFHSVDRNRDILGVVDHLLAYLPGHAHIVIATRRPPRLASLPRLRMIGEVNDIAEVDLRFTPEEVHALFSQVHDLCLSDEAVSAVAEQTEGWIIGLQLAARSLRSGSDGSTGDLIASLGANKRRLFEYLAEEVLKRQPAGVQRFIHESSVLSTLSPEDCDGVLGRTDSRAMLDYVEQNNLFVVEVADGCLRYHHLFRDFLCQQIKKEPGRLAELQRRAGRYFESRGDFAQATGNYLTASCFKDAARLIGKVGAAYLCLSRFDTLTYWIGEIPGSVLGGEPDLLYLQAQVFEQQGRYDLSQEWLERAAASFAAKRDTVGFCKVLRSKAFLAAWRLDRQIEVNSLVRETLEHLSPENKRERADLLASLVYSDLAAGNRDAAIVRLQEALSLYEELGDKDGMIAALITPAVHTYSFSGDPSEALFFLRRAHVLALEQRSKHRLAECLGLMALGLRCLNRCDEARECAEKAVALSREIGAVQLEARSLDYLGTANLGGRAPDLHFAKRCFEESARLAEREGNELVHISALMGEVVALRRLGDRAEAADLGDRALDIAQKSWRRLSLPTLQVNAGATIIGRDDARAEALLSAALLDFTRLQDKWNLTAANFWLAVLYSRRKPEEALDHLRASLELARANGHGFWFIEESSTAEPLLALATRQGIEPEYCTRLLREIRPDPASECVASGRIEETAAQPRKEQQANRPGGDTVGPKPLRLPTGDGATPIGEEPVTREMAQEQMPGLSIYCFGNFRVYVGDRLVQEEEWQRKDVKSLLKLLATTPDRMAIREQVIELFWGDLAPDVARSMLSKALHFLRRVLEPHLESYHSSYLTSRQGLLMLRPEMIAMIDVDEFTRHYDSGQRAGRLGDVDRGVKELEEAEKFYTGELFADDPYEDWTTGRRERFRNLHVVALEKLARWRADRGDYETAAEYSQKLLAEDCSREDIHALLMQCLARAGRRREALAQYLTCRRTLTEELRIEPASETEALYARILAGEAV